MAQETRMRGGWRWLAVLVLAICTALVLAAAPALAADGEPATGEGGIAAVEAGPADIDERAHAMSVGSGEPPQLTEEEILELRRGEELPEGAAPESTSIDEDLEAVVLDEAAGAEEPLQYEASTNIAEGTCGTCTWLIDKGGALIIKPTNGKSGTLAKETTGGIAQSWSGWAWGPYGTDWSDEGDVIRSLRIEAGVRACADMSWAFAGMNLSNGCDVSKLDTSSTTNLSGIFSRSGGCEIDLRAWDTSKVETLYAMFSWSYFKRTYWPLGSSSLRNMNNFFAGSSIEEIVSREWDTSRITSMENAFRLCYDLKSIDISSWDNRKASTTGFFELKGGLDDTTAIEMIVLGKNWDTSKDGAWPQGEGYPEKWWSLNDQKWYTNAQIIKNRRFMADTYTTYVNAPAEPEPVVDAVPVYRLYNRKTSEHLYTLNKNEYDQLPKITKGDWVAEGIAWYAPKTSKTPAYRLYNKRSGDHHYTTDQHERDVLVAKHGWTSEGVAFYSDDAKRLPLYRVYNSRLQRGQHHYTADANERKALTTKYGWADESIGFYGVRDR